MTEPRTTSKSDPAAEAVAAAIGRLGQATAAAIATESGVAYSTTNKKLRALKDAGRAEPFDGPDNRALWRLATAPGAAVEPAEAGTAAPVPDAAPRDAEPGDAAAGEVAAEVAGQAEEGLDTAGHPVTVAAEAVDAEPDRPDTATPGDEQARPAAHSADDQEGSEKVDSDARPSPSQPDPGPPVADAADPAPADAGAAPRARRASGTLDGAVLDILEADPDGKFKVSELCKLIDKAQEGTGAAKASPGAVVLAAQRLVGKNKAVLAVERPATFQLTPPTD